MTELNIIPRFLLEIYNELFVFIQNCFPNTWPSFDSLLLMCVTILRLNSGTSVANGINQCERPKTPLVLYETENDGECRLVRETMTTLDLDYESYPCPKEVMRHDTKPLNSRYRPQLVNTGGIVKLPFLIDSEKGVKLYTAKDINEYLWKTYGSKATPPLNYTLAHSPSFAPISLFLCQLFRPCMAMGLMRAPGRSAAKPLELWGYEGCPFVRRVREIISVLELHHVFHNVGKGSCKRLTYRKELNEIPEFKAKSPHSIQVPMLKDTNNDDICMLESSKIFTYLAERYQTYAVAEGNWFSAKGQDWEAFDDTGVIISSIVIFVLPLAAMTIFISFLHWMFAY